MAAEPPSIGIAALGLPGPLCQEFYKTVVETASDGFWLVDPAGRLVDVNPGAATISGFSRDTLLTMTVADLEARETPADVKAHLARLRESRWDRFETFHRRKDGGEVPVEVTVQYLAVGDGFAFVFVRDISERRRTEQTMMARLRLVDFAQDHSLRELLRATLDEVEVLTGSRIGFYHFVQPDQQTLSLQTWSTNTLAHMCNASGEGRHYPVSQAGVWTDCLHTRQPVIHNDYRSLPHRRGTPPGHAEVIRELTVPVLRGDRVTAILGVGNKATDYDSGDVQVVSTLADLAWDLVAHKQTDDQRLDLERRLLHAQKLESLGVLAGGIAHDFNNLLMAIMGNLDVALREPLERSTQPFLEEAMKASRKAAGLTQQMLAYSGRGKFVVRRVDVGALLEQHLPLFRTAVGPQITVDVDRQPDLPRIAADAEQLQQALMNLLTNASEAIGQEPGVIRIVARVEELGADALAGNQSLESLAPGRYLTLSVLDTGCGMTDETMTRLFDPFFTTKFTGRGLGMPAVQGIVRGHKGGILVSSAPGRGSLIRLLFPLPADAATAAQAVPAGHRHAASHPSRGRVLVADDEPAVRTLCRRMLEKLEYEAVVAADGEEAVAIFETDPDGFDAVLLDMTMPKLDGISTAIRLRSIRPGVRIIVSSGYGREAAAERFGEAQLAGFIQKPYTMAALQEALQRLT